MSCDGLGVSEGTKHGKETLLSMALGCYQNPGLQGTIEAVEGNAIIVRFGTEPPKLV